MERIKKQSERKRIQKYVPIRPAPKFETRIGTQKCTNVLSCETQSDLFYASKIMTENKLAKLQKKRSAPYMKSADKCL